MGCCFFGLKGNRTIRFGLAVAWLCMNVCGRRRRRRRNTPEGKIRNGAERNGDVAQETYGTENE